MNYEIGDSKYITLVGSIQSGKTNELINYCYTSVNYHKIPVIFILRNIKADLLQLLNRFEEHSILNKKRILIKSIYQFQNDSEIFDFLKESGIILLLCNSFHLTKINSIISNTPIKYNVCIDEADFSIKTHDCKSQTDRKMKLIKDRANHIIGATATPFAIFSTEKKMTKIKKMGNSQNYKGIESLIINFVEPIIIKNFNRFPHCDYLTIKKVYSECLLKNECVLLHSVIKEKVFHRLLFDYVSTTFKKFTVIIYNGDGIFVKCPMRIQNKPFAKNKSYNQFKQLIRGYYYNKEQNIHVFEKYGISEVLQILKDDPEYSHSHISIISGHLASRGISFVSNDYSLHLTDQYFHPSKSSHGENLLQSLRILGCYKDSKPLTLWCSKNTWESILEQHNTINKVVNNINDSVNWVHSIQRINIKKPDRTFTRPRLSKNVSWNSINTTSNSEFNLGINYYSSDSSDSK